MHQTKTFLFTDNLQVNGLTRFKGETTVLNEDNCESTFRKVGAVTGITTGIYKGGILMCSYKCHGDSIFVLCHQIGLLNAHYVQNMQGAYLLGEFAKPGDSGALVVIRDDKTDKVVGILTGWHTDGYYIVTPIQSICEQLRQDGWKIRPSRNEEPMQVNQC